MRLKSPHNSHLDETLFVSNQSVHIAKKAHKLFILSTAFGLLAFLVWAALTSVDTVTRGSGRIIPNIQNQLVQHFDGGIISEILVREGVQVKQGDILLRVINSFSQAELIQAELDLLSNRVKLARLNAEANDHNTIRFPEPLPKSMKELTVAEENLFIKRREDLREQVLITEDQIKQKELDLAEKQSRLVNMTKERGLVLKRIQSLKKLASIGALSNNELLENQVNLQKIKTKIADLKHQIPREKAALSEALRRSTQIQLSHKSEVQDEKIKTEREIAKLRESIIAMKDRKLRFDVRAPTNGVVSKIFTSTIGGVVKPGQNLVQIVPSTNSINVEVKISPNDRARVWRGLTGIVKITAYDYSVYGGLKGKIIDISPDAFQNENSEFYYRVRLEADTSSFGPDNPVLPGMIANVDILTGKHTILEYLLTPVTKLAENAFRR